MSDEQDWNFWLDEIEQKGVNLTSFEIDFIESLQAQRAKKFHMSPKQIEILERIYSSRTP